MFLLHATSSIVEILREFLPTLHDGPQMNLRTSNSDYIQKMYVITAWLVQWLLLVFKTKHTKSYIYRKERKDEKKKKRNPMVVM